MNIYALISQFWHKTEGQGASSTEAALYSYLLYLANMNRWKMPFTCATTVLVQRLHTSKQSIVKARETLQAMGVIEFEPGKGKYGSPKYTLTLSKADGVSEILPDNEAECVVENVPEEKSNNESDELSNNLSNELSNELSNNLSNELSNELSDELSDKLSDKLSDELSDKLSVKKLTNKLSYPLSNELSDKLSYGLSNKLSYQLSNINIKDKYKDKDRESESLTHARKEKSIDELEKAFAEDAPWHGHVVTAIRSPAVGTARDVVEYLHRFFDSERAKGVRAREENDCRSHFFNWLKIQIKTLNNNSYDAQKHADPRRGVEAAPRPTQKPGRPF